MLSMVERAVYVERASGDRSGITSTLIRAGCPARLCDRNRIVVKVNFVSSYQPLCATPVEAVRAFLDSLPSQCWRRVVVAEAPAIGGFREAVERYGYAGLEDEYGVELYDLSGDDYDEFYVWDRSLRRSVSVRVSKTILEADALVSMVRPKTHDTVVVTLSIKNVVVGAILPGYRHRIHQGYKAINLTIAYLATKMMPSLAVIDGYLGMEGDGPVHGRPKPLGLVVLGSPIESDALTSWLMGFEPGDIGYLYYLDRWGFGEIRPERIDVRSGFDWKSFRKRFEPHRTFQRQLGWRLSPEEEEAVARLSDELGLIG